MVLMVTPSWCLASALSESMRRSSGNVVKRAERAASRPPASRMRPQAAKDAPLRLQRIGWSLFTIRLKKMSGGMRHAFHMENTDDPLKAMLPKLRDRQSAPPRDAILTLIALAGHSPDHLVTLQIENRWQIVALNGNGIVLVTVDPGADTDWSLEHDRRPDAAAVVGRQFPIRAVESIEVHNARVFQSGWLESGLDIAGRYEYVVHISGGAVVEFPRDPTGRDHATADFVRELQTRL